MATLTVNIDSPPIPTGNTLWVDAVNGSDTTGTAGRQDLPFLTLEGAIAEATAGDLVRVRPGSYTVAANVWRNGCNVYLESGVVLSQSSASIFSDGGVSGTMSVTGYGSITTDGNQVVNLTGGSQMSIKCKTLAHTDPASATVVLDAGSLDLACDSFTGVTQVTDGVFNCNAINVRGGVSVQGGSDGSALIDAAKVTDGYFYCVDPVGTHSITVRCPDITASEISNSGGVIRIYDADLVSSVIHLDSGATEFYNCEIITPSGVQLHDYLTNAKAVRFVGCRLTTSGAGSPIDCIGVNAVTLLLANTHLVAIGGADSIDAANPVEIIAYGSYANTEVNANVTVEGSLHIEDGPATAGQIQVATARGTWGWGDVTVPDNAITNAKLANMAQATIKGRQAGSGTGDPEDLTATQALTVLGLGTAAQANTGTGSGDVPTITQADARYIRSQFAVLGSDFTTKSGTFVDVAGLSITLDANSTYLVEIVAMVQSSNTSTGYGLSLTVSGSPTHRTFDRRMFTTATNAIDNTIGVDDGGTNIISVDAANVNRPVNMTGIVVTAGSPSTIQVRLIRGGSANNVSVMAGATIIARKVA